LRPDLEKIFSPNWLIFGTRWFSGTRNRLAQVPSFKKIFLTPYRGYPMLKNFFVEGHKNVEKIDFLSWGTPIGGQKNFFRTRDLRQSISRARKPPCTKNQPIWRKKNFFREAYPPLMLKNAYFFNNSKIIIPFLKPLFKSCYSDPILGRYGSFFINFCKT